MERVKELREKILCFIKENKINYWEWDKIANYIEDKYENIKEKSTL